MEGPLSAKKPTSCRTGTPDSGSDACTPESVRLCRSVEGEVTGDIAEIRLPGLVVEFSGPADYLVEIQSLADDCASAGPRETDSGGAAKSSSRREEYVLQAERTVSDAREFPCHSIGAAPESARFVVKVADSPSAFDLVARRFDDCKAEWPSDPVAVRGRKWPNDSLRIVGLSRRDTSDGDICTYLVFRAGDRFLYFVSSAPSPESVQWVVKALEDVLCTSGHLFAIHGNALCVNGNGIVLTGPSGSGKTTLMVALLRAGAQYQSEELTLLTRDMRILPRHRDVRIGIDAAKAHTIPLPARPWALDKKGKIILDTASLSWAEFHHSAVPLSRICVIQLNLSIDGFICERVTSKAVMDAHWSDLFPRSLRWIRLLTGLAPTWKYKRYYWRVLSVTKLTTVQVGRMDRTAVRRLLTIIGRGQDG